RGPQQQDSSGNQTILWLPYLRSDGNSPISHLGTPTRAGINPQILLRRHLEEEMELVGANIGTIADEARESGLSFLKGKEVTWFELGLGCDVDRDKTERIRRVVRQDLGVGPDKRSRGTTRINLYHS